MAFRIAALALAAVSLAGARHLPIQIYTTAQGLPRNLVECMAFSQTGMLWVCTSEGLARFDGYRFQLFGPEHGLPMRRTLDMVPSRRGGYWLVTGAGICRFFPEIKSVEPCHLLESATKMRELFTDSVFESASGDTWFSSGKALFHVTPDGKRLEPTSFVTPGNETILMLSEGLDGDLLVGTDFDLFSWRPGQPQHKITRYGEIGAMGSLRRASGDMLLSATNGLFRLSRSGDGYSLTRIPGKGLTRVNVVMQRHDGSIWIGGNGGAQRIDVDAAGNLQVLEFYRVDDGLPSSEVTGLKEDAEGNLWGATEGAGLFRIAAGGFVTYFAKDGLRVDRIASILEDGEKRVIVETSWGSFPDFHVRIGDRFQGIPVMHPASVNYMGWGWSQLSTRTQTGEWWIPTGLGILRFPRLARLEDISHTAPRFYGEQSSTGCREIFRMFGVASGDLWFTCVDPHRALIRWQRSTDTFRAFDESDGWSDAQAAVAFRQAPNGTVWVGTSSWAVRYRNGRFERFPLNEGRSEPLLKDLMVDHTGRVWIGTEYAGLLRCDNPDDAHPVFRQYTVRQGLSTNAVQTVVEDNGGFIYAGTAVGVDRIDPEAPIESRRIRHFTSADGLPDTQLTTSFRDSRGHLWFGSLHGLSEFDPASLPRHAPPQVYVMRIRVRGEDMALPWGGARKASLDLAPDRNQVEIEYAGTDLGSAASLHYQYRLYGVDPDWSAPVDRTTVNYASLPSGRFHFDVRAVNPDGQVSQEAATIDLLVETPIWRRWWFVVSASLLLAVVAAKVYDYRVRNLLAIERLRIRIATDLHDDIGASLTQISILSELARRSRAEAVLSDIANIARDLSQDMSDIVWAVNPRHDRFEGLLHRMRRFANDTLAGAEIDVTFEAERLPSDLAVPLDARRPLYLVFKEAVHNVARHSGATRAAVRLSLEGAWLKLTVEDNGRGFDPAAEHSGEGVASIQRRLREFGGKASWDSLPSGGTRFVAVMPLRPRHRLPELVGFFRRPRG